MKTKTPWEIAEGHLKVWMKKNVSITTQETYLVALKPLRDHFGKYKIENISAPVIERFKNNQKKGSLVATINLSLAVLSRILQVSYDHGNLETVPRVHYLRLKKKRDRILEPEDIKKILRNTKDPLRLMVLIALSTGLQKSNLFNLKWIELKNDSIDIMSKEGKRIHIPLSDQVNRSIEAYKAQQTVMSEYVFPAPNNPHSPRHRSSDLGLKKICDSLGIKGVTFKTFRHTFSYLFFRENADPKLLQEILGYRNKAQVDRYVKIVMNDKREAIEKLSKTLPLDL